MPRFTIAMVEDEETMTINRTILKEIPDYELIWEATAISEAIKKITLSKPDLLLLDIYFSDNNGLFLLKYLKETGQITPTIIITAVDEVQTVLNIFDLGIYDYLLKPYLKKRFIQAITDFSKSHIHNGRFTQTEIDRLVKDFKEHQTLSVPLPKGLSQITMELIINTFKDSKKEMSAEDIAKLNGIAVVSVRRYLQFLTETRKIQYRPVYGMQGRPVHRYFLAD